ncbi:hypothetical protein D1BOALGB6SA_8897 [Olavius sp. associated proteobacterium Delta 1]|nr:hypothetical protein D1BOALGB6SA_8897 [Olavius sp. associated proteobacterium Delta 1]
MAGHSAWRKGHGALCKYLRMEDKNNGRINPANGPISGYIKDKF